MQITVATDATASNVFPLEVGVEMEMENFLALCQLEIPGFAGVPLSRFAVAHNGRVVHMNAENLKKTIADFGFKDNDMVIITARGKGSQNTGSGSAHASAASSSTTGGTNTSQMIANLVSAIRVPSSSSSRHNNHHGLRESEVAQLRLVFEDLRKDVDRRESLRETLPELVGAAEKHDFDAFCKAYVDSRTRAIERQRAMLDPTNPEGQRLIAEQIQRENIDFSHHFALEHMPEAYIPVTMLYIKMKINGIEVKAFVDSGAQVSILSERCARNCNLMRLVDKRFKGIVHGVGGSQKLIGKIHTCQVQVEDQFFPCNFDVLADRDIDILLGLDILKRHRCTIDLKNNCLRFGESTATPFLSEAEIPKRDMERPIGSSSEASNVEVDSAKLASLMALGFEEAASRAMLIQCGNDLEAAAAMLLASQTAAKS